MGNGRRKFDEALNTVPNEQQQTSKPAEALCYVARLFRMEQEFAEFPAEERYAKRLEQEKPVLAALLKWAEQLTPACAPAEGRTPK